MMTMMMTMMTMIWLMMTMMMMMVMLTMMTMSDDNDNLYIAFKVFLKTSVWGLTLESFVVCSKTHPAKK